MGGRAEPEPTDPVERDDRDSFPASDPPSHWAGPDPAEDAPPSEH